ncbi:hypothetical protein [Moorena producens]|uniref:hypothetical protein n=1 Tax=Moorena producens TaxID=1155739 RepID=UPI00131489C9|nr:hypothetical protein [Moorena producens]
MPSQSGSKGTSHNPIAISRYSDSRFPIPDSRFPVPCSRLPVPYRFNHDLQSTARHYHRGLQWDWQSYCQIISPEGS